LSFNAALVAKGGDVVVVAVKRRGEVNQVNAFVGQFPENVQVVATDQGVTGQIRMGKVRGVDLAVRLVRLADAGFTVVQASIELAGRFFPFGPVGIVSLPGPCPKSSLFAPVSELLRFVTPAYYHKKGLV
jgi:hypothetical protein